MDTSDLLYLSIACPACSGPAHVVASVLDGRSRWCCISCQVIGNMPLSIERAPVNLNNYRIPPVASA